LGDPIIHKRHGIRKDEEYDSVIFLVRDFKEAIPSFRDSREVEDGVRYARHIKKFESLKVSKLLIYYEDLLLQPEIEIRRMCRFLSIGDEKVPNFMNNYEKHRDTCIDKCYRRSITKGSVDKLHYHAERVEASFLKALEREVRDNLDKDLFDKYLGRYIEVDGCVSD
jgi:hypothetical protein